MKRLLLILMAVLAIAVVAGCSVDDMENNNGANWDNAPAVFQGKIVNVDQDMLMLVSTQADSAELYRMPVADVKLADEKGKEIAADQLKAGMLVDIGFSGEIAESYPAQLNSPQYLKVTGAEDDLVGFYLGVLNDLYEKDSGLNNDLKLLAFDLSQTENLSEAEKAALVWLMGEAKGLQTITGTYDELVEQGYIDKEQLVFEEGLLFSITTKDVGDNNFKFDAQKWRSGLGAYFYQDCTATKTSDGWSYSIGAEAIS